LGGLYFKEWLNDDVINIYIEMMEKRFIRENITSYRILNSYFATNTLGKTETQIQRVLKKKTLDKSHILIMPINNRNHWYFAIFDEGEIVVHDSMKHDANYYLENPIFKNALKFSKMFYERQYTLVVRDDYPQQDNHYDCGVFMLMGIRDTLRKKQWTFHQGDIRFKRIQIAHEILEENLIFSDL
jgi:sentrin-specific protease 1